jgi:two-component system, NtrC family, sensor histidine kinase HydH
VGLFLCKWLRLAQIFHIEMVKSFSMQSTTETEQDLLYGLGRILAHELNNPISAISSAAYLIDDFASTAEVGKLDVELIKPFIGSIREECMKLKYVVEEYTKFVTTRSSLPSALDLKAFIEARRRELEGEGLTIELAIDISSQVSIDAGQLQTMFQSLAESSKLAGATNLKISGSETADHIELVFEDNRPTENCDDPSEAFEPIATKRRRGLGLKLPTVKRIIDLHHGSVAAGLKDGIGCCITISLPKAASASVNA